MPPDFWKEAGGNLFMEHITLTGFADEMSPELDRQIEGLSRLGVRYVELRGVDGTNVSDLSDEQVKTVRKKLEAAGIGASSIGSPIGKIGIREDFGPHMEKLRRTLEIQKELGAPYLRMFSFYLPAGEDPALFRGEVLDRMGRMVREAERWDAMLLHENEKGIYGDTAPRCLDLMQELSGPHFQAVFDFANFVEVGQDTGEAFAALKPYIEYVHIKDADKAKKIVPAGEGEGRVREILRELFAGGYRGFLSLEPHLVDFAGLKDLEQNPEKRGSLLTGEAAWELALSALRGILKELGVEA